MSKKLESKVAVVTGGSTGIGRAVARHLAEAGARVVVTGRHEATLKESAAQHPDIVYLVADVAQPEDAARTVEEVRRRYGRLDILVNNAGVAPMVPLPDAKPDHVRGVFDVNVSGLIELTRQALPLLRDAKGVVVNVASVVADRPFANMSVYAASKAAVLALTRSWAKELAPDGVRVNAVSPGPIETPIFGKTGLGPEQLEAMSARILHEVPANRLGQPDEAASVVAFLASPQASYVTGAQYTVGGGSEA